jgi:hypothetical protein
VNLIILPYLDCSDATRLALEDALAQSSHPYVLLIDNGSQDAGRIFGEVAEQHPRVRRWRYDPPMPSLSACWNTALEYAWASGAEEALVINNDIRLWSGTFEYLRAVQQLSGAHFVSATGVTPAQYETFLANPVDQAPGLPTYPLPGPDFSCFLITRACHALYPFDTGYVPAYCEDLDYHRRLMLAGDGDKIFGTGLPFLHVGSGTLNGLSESHRAVKEVQITTGSRVHHQRKWGGGANQERYTTPFHAGSARDGVTTGELFERVRNGEGALGVGRE